MGYQFRKLYDLPFDVLPDDSVMKQFATLCEASGVDSDRFNTLVNATLKRATDAAQAGSLDPAGLRALFMEQAAQEGLSGMVAGNIAQAMSASMGGAEPRSYSPEDLRNLESFIDAQWAQDRLTDQERDALYDLGQTVDGVSYIEGLMAFAEDGAPSPGPMPTAQPAQQSQPAEQPPATTDQPTQEKPPMSNDEHYPRVVQSPLDMAKPAAPADTRRTAQIEAYSLIADPRYSERGPAGDLFRAGVDATFAQAFADADASPTGSSIPGLGA